MFNISDMNKLQLLETLPIIAFLKDEQGRYVWVNQTFLSASGFNSINQVKGKSDYDLLDKKYAEPVVKADKTTLSTGKAMNFKERFEVQGNEIHVSTVKFPTQISGQTYLFGFAIQE